MIYRMVLFPMTFSEPLPWFQGHSVTRGLDALDILCVQLTRNLFAIVKFLFSIPPNISALQQYVKTASSSTMNAAKMKPWGIAPRCPSASISSTSTVCAARVWGSEVSTGWYCDSGGVRAGVHSRTNVYIEPSNNDWIMPRHSTFRSAQHKWSAWQSVLATPAQRTLTSFWCEFRW